MAVAGPEEMRELVRRFYEDLWNAWDDTAVEELLVPEFRFRGSLGNETTGWSEWRAYRDHIRAGAPDFHNEIEDLVAETGRAAARLIYTGTHAGPLLGIPATYRRFAYAGAALFSASEGRLGAAWVIGDVAGLRRQLTERSSTASS